MSYFNEAETEAFLDIFLSNGGADIPKKDVYAFLNDLNHPDMDEQTLRDNHMPSVYTAVTDAINTWNAGKRYAWSQTIRGMR